MKPQPVAAVSDQGCPNQRTLRVVAAVEPQVKARPIEVALIVRGVYTYFDLSPEKLTTRPNQPLPVVPEIEFTYSPDAEQK